MTAIRLVEPELLPAALRAVLDGSGEVIAAGGGPELGDVTLDSGGVVVTTSGSTGTPKHVLLAAAALRAGADMAHAWLGGPGRWLTALPTAYVAGLMTIVRAHVGGRGWGAVAPDLHDLGDQLGGDGPCYLSIVPTQLVRALADPALVQALAQADAVLVGGARLDVTTWERARSAGIRVVRTYGLSETAGGVVYDGEPLPGVTIGFAADEPGDTGATGSARISLTTPTAFSGYLGDPVTTAAVLHGQTVLTADRGYLADGRLRVTGRVDAVVQSGGVNVDLAALQRHVDEIWGPGEIIVFAVADRLWGSRMMAAATRPVSADEIVERLGDRVTAAARPRGVLVVPELPLLASGKPDRRQLARLWEGQHGDGR